MWSPFSADAAKTGAPLRPSLTLYFCLVGAFLLALLPHVAQLPFWVSLSVLAAMFLRSVTELRRWPLPSPTFCGFLALVLLAAIYRQFDTVVGRDAGTAFMAALLAIKFFELRGPRDVVLIIFSSFFIVISSLLYSQTLELFVYCLIMMWILTALLLRTGMGDRPDNRLLRVLRLAGLIFLQALPLTVFLFFFCPRYPGVLQVGMDDTSIGLTDRVEPGSISRLSDDDSTAMIVRFWNRNPPDAATAYWRAIVLWTYQQDALKRGAWIVGLPDTDPRDNSALPRPLGDDIVSQEITINPHLHRWLFAFDAPTSLARPTLGPTNSFSEVLPGDVLQLTAANGLLVDRQRYNVESSTDLAPADLPAEQRRLALQLPKTPDGKIDLDSGVLDLAARLQENAPTVDAYILAVLHYFRHGGFVYSDSPGQGGPNALAHFLLRDKIGFCEHYASAFAVLMRLGHYPARLVVGYHGAQYNPYKNIYVVKQSNAHSWDEVWIESEKRWRRVDPTTVISRISADLAQDGSDPAANESLSIEVAHRRVTFLSSSALPAWMRRSMLEVQLRREELEADWNDWVFSYDPQTQNRLAQALGFHGEARYLFTALSLAAVAVCALVLGFAMNRRRRAPVEALYHRFCRHLARHGLPRAEWEGPLAYTDRAAAAYPDRRTPIHDLGHLVARTRYAPHPPETSRREMRELLQKAEGKRRT